MHGRHKGARWAPALAAAFAIAACGEEPVGPDERDGMEAVPRFHENPQPLLFITGGGRFDYPPGEPGGPTNKNTPEAQDFQTFGFNVGDRDGDGAIEGQVQYVDHRRDQRIEGRPLDVHSVSWSFFERRPADTCTEGGAIAIGVFEIKNTGERMEGQIRVCDNGEPGNREPGDAEDPPDHFYIALANGYQVAGYLTGGNIQAHFQRR